LLIGFFLFLVGWTILAAVAAKVLVVSVPLDRADAIVVLSGSKAYKERTAYAASLYRQGVAPLVVLTNDGEQGSWSNVEERNPFFHELAARELEQHGVPASAIKLWPAQVQGTMDEAFQIREFCRQSGAKSVLLVTSEYHSRRAYWVFDQVLKDSEVRVGVSSPSSSRIGTIFWWLRPQGWKTVGAEYVKMVYYYKHVTPPE
jgi:uncharacterized SAM-binding protein YcdF (DUF218 family)